MASDDLVDRLGPAGRADPTGRTFAAAFLGAEFEGEARLAREIDGVVEDDDPAMAEHALGGEHRLVVQRGVEQLFRKIGAERAADLNSADRPPGPRPAAEAFDQFADRGTEGEFDKAAVAHVARDLKRLGAERAADAILGVSLGAVLQDPGGRSEAQDIVDDGRFAEQTRDRRQRRLGAHLSALALEALEQRGLLPADIGACAEPRLEIEGVGRAEDAATEEPARPRLLNRPAKDVEGVRVFGADVNVADGGADRGACDRHALDQQEGIALHQHAVGERAAIALVGVADDKFLVGLDAGDSAPFDARREPRAAASAKTRGQNLLDSPRWPEAQRALEPFQAAMATVVVERERIGHAATGEDEALLSGEIGDVLDPAQRGCVRPAGQKSGLEQRRRVRRRDWPVAHAPLRRLDLDERLQPEEAARTRPHDPEVDPATPRFAGQRARNSVRSDGKSRRISRNENSRAHGTLPSAPATIASIRSRSSLPSGSPSKSAAGESAQFPRQ